MRIVAGRHRGRRLEAPEGLGVRPTADRTREAVFNILTGGRLDWRGGGESPTNPLIGARVLDAFAGTGALGLEALSRGAGHVTFMESQAAALAVCRHNVSALDEEARASVLQADVLRPPPAPAPCHLVLMDPPYGQDMATPALRALRAAGWIAPGAIVTVELMAREPFAAPEGFSVVDERKYGKARVVFLQALG
ncbi:MAG: 16S rRNA (guanine(966)-N(2))-methyltransferase RsmD [Alphaproteobacteria bacterium]|nr:MAG: 16S rRNA (guanine(966)-N(2))-methyltransferase RsmD [Alphaproteobacteria bacterium]